MFQTKSNSSYINISKNAEKIRAAKSSNNFNNGNKKAMRGFSASNGIKLKSSPFSFTNQSPKISSGKIRNALPTQKLLFSLLDINDKKTNARGTSIPMAFIRRTNDEIIKILNIKIKPSSIRKESAKETIREKALTPVIVREASAINDKGNAEVDTIDIEQQCQQLPNKQLHHHSVSVKDKDKETTDNQSTNNEIQQERTSQTIKVQEKHSLNSQSHRNITKPKTAIPNQRLAIASIDNPNPHTLNDKWKPVNYCNYELLVKNPELMKKEVLLNTFARKLPNISIKEIRDKSRQSDIFFTQPKEDNFYEKVHCYTDFQNSDIFLLKNDKFSQSKSGERNMIVKDTRLETYTVSKKSNSEWHAKNSMPTLLNHNSTDWNLTNPDIRNIGKTKTEITKECRERDEKFNPIYRQKSLCEFIDLTRNGAPNPNRSYLNCLNKTMTCFNRRSDVCATFNDIFGSYRDLCDKPFSKPKLI